MQWWSIGTLVRGPNGMKPSPSRIRVEAETEDEAEEKIRLFAQENFPDGVYLDPDDNLRLECTHLV